jgi:hypothetical protein
MIAAGDVMFGKLFGGRKPRPPSEAEYDAWYVQKSERMEKALGPDHEVVLHALIGYEVGGPLHTYFYCAGVPGTAIATKQLARLDSAKPTNAAYRKYELVMFTREAIAPGEIGALAPPDQDDKLGLMRGALNAVARYAEEVQLNPGETLEFPGDFGAPLAGRCFVLDAYRPDCFDASFGLMALMEVHRDEMELARRRGGAALVALLKEARCYPYSDPEQRRSVAVRVQ